MPVTDRLKVLLGPVVVALAYYAGAMGAFAIGTLSDKIFAPFWPPNAILFCGLVLAPRKHWPLYLAAVLPAHIAAEMFVSMPPLPMAIAFLTNCAIAVLSAEILFRLMPSRQWFGSFPGTLAYLVVAAGVVPALVALCGAFVPILSGAPIAQYWSFWGLWYVGNALAFLTLAPFIVTWAERGIDWRVAPLQILEALIVTVLLVVSCELSIDLGRRFINSGYALPILYLPLPFIAWAAVRFGSRGASGAALIVSVVSTWAANNGDSVFFEGSPEATLLALQIFLASIAVVVLLLGASIDQLRTSEAETRKLASSLLRAQDEERRRIAREMHDTTGQQLIAAKMLIDKIGNGAPVPPTARVDELRDLVEQSIRDVRTVSYLLHPPLLEEGGLKLAIEHFIAGYVQRTGIKVDSIVSSDLIRLPKDTELALFHVIREALTNVSRHSRSPNALLSLKYGPGARHLILLVEDFGRGIPSITGETRIFRGRMTGNQINGVGLSSMRERLHQIGADLAIESRVGRTTLRATIPLGPMQASA